MTRSEHNQIRTLQGPCSCQAKTRGGEIMEDKNYNKRFFALVPENLELLKKLKEALDLGANVEDLKRDLRRFIADAEQPEGETPC